MITRAQSQVKMFCDITLSSTNIFNSDPFLMKKTISDDVTTQQRASLVLHKRFQVHFSRTICLHRIKASLLKVKSVQNNITQRIQIGVSHLCTHIQRWRRILVRLLSLRHGRQYCLGYSSDMRTEVADNIAHPSLYPRHACKVDSSSTSQACRW